MNWKVKYQHKTNHPFVTNGTNVITFRYHEEDFTEELAHKIAKALNE